MAIDFGTSSTCAAVSVDGRTPQVVVVDGAPLVPSAVYATGDGTLFVGHEADRQAAVDPSRYEPHPKRRIDEPELLLGDTVLPVVGVVRAVLRRALHEARHLAGGAPVDQLVLTHPADWGGARTQKLRRCAAGLAGEIVLVPEPVAAAVFHSEDRSVPEGGCLAVLDLGGGTVDASVVRRVGGGFHVLATRGDPNFGGADIDQALLEHVGTQVADTDQEAWRRLVEGRELADRRRRRVLRQDIRGAKETLSRHTYTDVPMPPPFPDAHVTRADLEALIAVPMRRTVALLADTLTAAGLRPDQLVGVFLVGGSSRIPMVSRLLHEQLGVVPVTLDQPETVVARGGLRAVRSAADQAGQAGHQSAHQDRAGYQQQPLLGGPPPAVPTGQPGLGPPGSGQLPPHQSGPHHIAPYLIRHQHQGGQPVQAGVAQAAAPAGGGYYPGGPTGPGGLTGPPARPGSSGRPGSLRSGRAPWLLAAAAVAVVVVGVVVAVALRDDPRTEIAEYHYRFTVPEQWQRSGGSQNARQVDLGPADASVTPDQIFVKENELSYDADADRARAVGELRSAYEQRRSGSDAPSVDGFDDAATFAGRDVLYYSEVVGDGTVDWYVVFGGRFQVSIGCQHDEGGRERVLTACDSVVRTLTVQK